MESTAQPSLLKRGPGRPRALQPVMFTEAKTAYLHWLRTAPKKEARPNTLRSVAATLGRWEDHLGFSFDLRALTQAHCKAFVDKRREQGIKRSTINFEVGRLRSLLNFLVKEHEPPLLPFVPVDIAKLMFVRVTDPPVTIVSDEDMRRLVQASIGIGPQLAGMSRTTMAILIAFHVGFRHQEICNLQRRDVHLEGNTLRVVEKEEFDFYIKDDERRAVPMSPELRKALEAWLEAMPAKEPRAWLFPGVGFQPIGHLYEDVKLAFDAAGIGDAENRPGLHSLRRTWATNLLAGGADIETVRQLGGWSDLKTVQRYLNSTTERMHQAVKGLPSVMQPAAEPEPAPTADVAAVLAKLAAVMSPEELAAVARKLMQ